MTVGYLRDESIDTELVDNCRDVSGDVDYDTLVNNKNVMFQIILKTNQEV